MTPIEIVVCVKQVIDPETPASMLVIDPDGPSLVSQSEQPLVLNGFDENAVEAALRIKDSVEANITVISMGSNLSLDVLKKPISMGADRLVLLQDELFDSLDSYSTALVISEGIKKTGKYDLIITGRQASDWDNAQVGLGIAEMLGLGVASVAQQVELVDNKAIVHQTLPDGYEIAELPLPAVVTITNELGEPRYPTLRGIIASGRKPPTVWTASDIGVGRSDLSPKIELIDLSVSQVASECELIGGEDDVDAGRNLALRLREGKFI